MKQLLFDIVLTKRAKRIFKRLSKHITPKQQQQLSLIDIGSGTGHNAQIFRSFDYAVTELDIVDFNTTKNKIVIFDGQNIPFADNNFDVAMMLYILQYTKDPQQLLLEVKRVTKDKILLIQSNTTGKIGLFLLKFRELFMGRWAFYGAKIFGLVPSVSCSMTPQRYLTKQQMQTLLDQAELNIVYQEESYGFWPQLTRTLYVLQKS